MTLQISEIGTRLIDAAIQYNIALAIVLFLYGLTIFFMYKGWRYYSTELKEAWKEMMDTKQHTYEVLKDVANVLDNMEVTTRENKVDIIRKIEEARNSIHEKISDAIK